jgi:hypothetical protein
MEFFQCQYHWRSVVITGFCLPSFTRRSGQTTRKAKSKTANEHKLANAFHKFEITPAKPACAAVFRKAS